MYVLFITDKLSFKYGCRSKIVNTGYGRLLSSLLEFCAHFRPMVGLAREKERLEAEP